MGFQSDTHPTERRQTLKSRRTCEWILFLVVLISFWAAPEAQALQVSPTSLSFTVVQGGTNPPSQTLSFYKKNRVLKSWSITDSAPWVSVSPTSGTISTETEKIITTVNSAGLAAGSYQAKVTITLVGPKGGISTTSVPVTLTVTAVSTPPTISLSPTSLSFTGTQGGTNPAVKTTSITNTGGGTLSWTVSDNAAWLSLSPASGTTTTETDAVTASVNLAGHAAGTYNATITATATGATNSPRTMPVTLTVTSPATSSATLTWNANTESDLAGYKIYVGTVPGVYGPPTSVGNVTTCQVPNLATGQTYYFSVTAVDTSGNESLYSNEVSKSIY